jgi:Kef-type K+ transport system membrane component KefB
MRRIPTLAPERVTQDTVKPSHRGRNRNRRTLGLDPATPPQTGTRSVDTDSRVLRRSARMSAFELSVRFFLQLTVILAACRVVGWLAKRVGQPQVVAEMITGVILGPSLLGLFESTRPAQQWLFPPASKAILFSVCQVGLALYMFLVGVEFRSDLFRSRLRAAASVSVAGMLVPFLLGGALAWWLIRNPGAYFTPKVKAWEAMLFLGASMCITAFPMLARIIVERGLAGTSLGTLALAAGAMDDAAAWCLLAVVLASFKSDWTIAYLAIGGGILYVGLVLTAGRRLLAGLGRYVQPDGLLPQTVLGGVLALVMLGSWFTDAVGIYAVFGAFILGCAMPRGTFSEALMKQVEPMVVVFLLPTFFTYSGLNTRLDLVTTPELWAVAVVVLAAACLGKFGACWAAARLNGEDQPTSLAVGTLMNARGLMELIILNIGLERGLITPPLFSIMVVMAIATTLMASPVFEWVYGRRARAAGTLPSRA